ncbi:MAG: hypothetical protein M5R36_11480 [Deltaproteobacteria bacterium]|nr:hypothetical protein [Deltaproteobacteria bacterium]
MRAPRFSDLADEGDPWEALAGYSAAAEMPCRLAFHQALRDVTAARGRALKTGGDECAFAVLGMGKLGGRELNASSDIDIVYIFESEDGETEGGAPLTEWAADLAWRIGELLGTHGAGLRVDLRLRPGGQYGPLAASLASAEAHYEYFGQAWERQMLVRARAIAGSGALGEAFIDTLRPFVYRRRMDPAALAEIRRVKRRIDAEVAVAAGGDENVKLSRGGIRELEYVVQTYQLLYGGRLPNCARRRCARRSTFSNKTNCSRWRTFARSARRTSSCAGWRTAFSFRTAGKITACPRRTDP